jgi:DNA polymerase-1
MRHATYGNDPSTASVAILVKETSFNSQDIKTHYIDELGANPEGFIAMSLWYDDNGKCPAALAKDYLQTLLLSLQQLQIKTLLITDSAYFKFITECKQTAQSQIGHLTPSKIAPYASVFDCWYVPNFHAAQYNPKTSSDLTEALRCLKSHLTGSYQKPGNNVMHWATYPQSPIEVKFSLATLLNYPELTIDIETKGLKFWNCGIATIAFAWDKHNFISIPVDRGGYALVIKPLLKEFFEQYTGKVIFHNAGFDMKVLTYELWMKDLQDIKGMIDGIQALTRDFEDTKLIAYLATNNAVENVLKLKVLAASYMGNYAQEDIEDTNKIPLPQLLEYNGQDCLATWFVYETYYPKMVADDQERIYFGIFKPSVITLLQTELVGMPILPDKVASAKKKLSKLRDAYMKHLNNSKFIQEFQLDVQHQACLDFTNKAKKKVFTMDDPKVQRLTFNPNSDQQVGNLLYNYMGLPILDYTDTKQPSSAGKTLAKLINHTTNQEYIEIIKALIGLAQVSKILTSFIPAFEGAIQMPDGSWRLFGNFNLGGTVSARLSSSDPNLQNLPANSIYGKLIKECFGCIGDWLFGGADFNSLEDMVSALTTRDTNKMKCYLDGFDGHSLRAYSYFKDQMPDITDSVTSINSIADKYPHLRQASKAPTFLLTYQGTYHGLMNNLGLDQTSALVIEANYHDLYKEADKWVNDRLQQACIDGYVTGAFGLRLRTPLLKMNGKGKLNYKAAAEGRTAGNMLGQSYGQLNSRAANEFRERIWASEHKYDILLCAQIHDAIYLIWKNTAGITKWINDNLIACMQWCGLVELQHPTVKLGAALDIFHPDWSKKTTLDNNANVKDIYEACRNS